MKLSDNKYLLYRHRWIYPYVKILLGTIRFLAIVASLLLIVAFIYEHGFVISYADVETLSKVYHGVWIVFLVDIISHLLLRFGSTRQQMNIMSWLLVSLYLLTLVPVIFHQPDDGPIKQFWLLMNSRTYRLVMSMLLAFVTLSGGISRLLSRKANPSVILAISFLFIILVGTGLLLLPRCTYNGISWIDALFLSTSAVCVTGMSPIDITQTFTEPGLAVLMTLFQIGGLGVMTFTSFFTLFFMGNTSIYNSMMVRDMVSGNSLNSLLSTLLYILSFTIVIEATGAFMIWSDIHGTLGYELADEIKFSVFHAVSAFCNAGFSTLPNGLANPLVFGSHAPFYLYLSILIMLGGIGFPILVNFKDTIVSFLHRLWTLLRYHHWEGRKLYHAYNLNSRIVLIMTAFLLIVPTICFAVLEWNGALLGLTLEDKLTHAFFMAVCPRSAGFASINLRSMLRGSDRVEVFHRELSHSSIRRANTTVLLSIAALGLSIFIMNMLEPDVPLRSVFFECLGALSTDGVSLGATSMLHDEGRLFMIPLMFIGRLGVLTIMMGLVKQKKVVNYRYPVGEIIIN